MEDENFFRKGHLSHNVYTTKNFSLAYCYILPQFMTSPTLHLSDVSKCITEGSKRPTATKVLVSKYQCEVRRWVPRHRESRKWIHRGILMLLNFYF